MGNEMSYEALIERLKSTDVKMNEAVTVAEMVSRVVSSLVTERVNKNMTQRDLAKLSGIKQSAIARMERMQVVPRLDTVAKLAYHLGMNLNFSKQQQKSIIITVQSNYNFDYEESLKIAKEEATFNLENYNKEYGYKKTKCCTYS